MHDRIRTNWSPELSLLEFAPSAGADGTSEQDGPEGTSQAVTRLRARASAIARTGFRAALVTGEPGCGKHRVARWLHRGGGRGERALAFVDATLPDAPSAVAELAAGIANGRADAAPGNLVVRNVQRASAPLLRRLVELVSRQGDPATCGLLLLSTTPASALRARSLEHEQLIGRSMSALLDVPPLRERVDDIGDLARAFLAEAGRAYDRPVRGLSPAALSRLEHHAFPGNIRELRMLVERAVLHGTGDWITADDLGLPAGDEEEGQQRGELRIRLPGASLREIELQALRLALRIADGRLVRAAELLGITRHALRRKLGKYNLDSLRTRPGNDDELETDRDAYI
jgi:DNA-binding NtrC family response regulator